MSVLLAVDDGIAHGNNNAADVLFLIACVLFGIGAIIAYTVKTFYATLIAAGLCLVALGWLLL